jgi:hypothetical protein
MSKIAISGASTGTATFTIESPATSTNRTLTLPDNTGTILTNATAGTVLQVVQATSTTVTTVTSTSFTDSGLSGSITPTSASSKILVLITQPIYVARTSATNWTGTVQIVRDSTAIWVPANFTLGLVLGTSTVDATSRTYMTLNYLDSPATTSSVTYKTQIKADSSGTVTTQPSNSPSQIILMEIAA